MAMLNNQRVISYVPTSIIPKSRSTVGVVTLLYPISMTSLGKSHCLVAEISIDFH